MNGDFFRSRWVDPPAGTNVLDPAELPGGFRAGGVPAGLKGDGSPDLGGILCGAGQVDSSILLTDNAAAAAPVQVCRDRLDHSGIRAVIVNSGNANAATGDQGVADALSLRDGFASALGLDPVSVAVAETGVIGVPLEIDRLERAIPSLCGGLSETGGDAFTRAIMTTDRWPKACSLELDGVRLSVQAKGAGMIEPGFATMLCFIQTDGIVPEPNATLRTAVDQSFGRITVDGQSSTNDTVLLQASGTSGKELSPDLLGAALLQLALEIVADGEGAERIGRIEVRGAASEREAESVARAIANSLLVKTALFGRDPNWGRIVQAAGTALAGEDLTHLGPDSVTATELGEDVREAEVAIELDRGAHRHEIYFSDLGHGYIEINAEYTT
jgi:glutamate N-acetyltransferase/amino-acid N-acetyltransferase